MGIDTLDKDYILNHLNLIKRFFKDSKVLITGGTGFIGKWVLETLHYLNETEQLDINISVLSRNPKIFIKQYPHLALKDGISFLEGDILKYEFPEKHYDYIIHAATDASASMNVRNPLIMSDVIVKGTRNILDFAVWAKPKKILFLSSGAVYGKQPEEIAGLSEEFMGAPNTLAFDAAYGESKRLAEFLCSAYCRHYNTPVTIARCFAFTGPYLPLDSHYAIGNFINNGLHGTDITVTGNGLPLRTYMYASDLIIWLMTILTKGNSGEAYNVGSDKPVSVKELANKVADFFPGTSVKILNQVKDTDRNYNYVPDIRKARSQFNFGEGVSLEESIFKTIQFYKKHV